MDDEDLDTVRAQLNVVLKQNTSLAQQNAQLLDRLEQAQVSPVRPKLAAFWLDRPAAWFAHIEAQFALSDVSTDETK